jgi:hypothetical protein
MRAVIYWLWDFKDFSINLNRRCAKLRGCRVVGFCNSVEDNFRLSTFGSLIIIFIYTMFQTMLWEQPFCPACLSVAANFDAKLLVNKQGGVP